ncbi:putative tannase and feruloyl esterase [Rosellinia necatrix]|uniref:Carboxylic ester hydrolase n=1 Tax=Rosellinia necatrix TaxID=77044 RepID=A0A1W2TS55_ROSNE|nr:putative tannase and feruloyl esterase [Rosellinia necatrix]
MYTSLAQACEPATFSGLDLFGAEIVSVRASLVSNYSASVPSAYRYTFPSTELVNATFCNVTVSYTHPGQNDNVIVEAWLPEKDDWNERFLAVGGGGWVAGRFFLSYAGMNGAIADGYATITTDAGLGSAMDASPWALLSPGNVNLYNLQNLGSTSLNDEAVLGKQFIQSYYGKPPKFSYWNGCSQGGRQGMMLAQRYPDAYDGIAAGAPAIYWTEFFASVQWPQQVMNMAGEYPYSCEIEAINAAAVSACDELDGVKDGIISLPDECLAQFDPFQLVGTHVNCTEAGGTIQISNVAATVTNATWRGTTDADGKKLWHGLNPGSDLTGTDLRSYGQTGVAATDCTSGTCTGAPSILGQQWLELFIARNPGFDFSNLTHAEFDRFFRASGQMYRSMIGTGDADLRDFKNAGGKLVTFHGMNDNIIPPGGTKQYYDAVAEVIPDVHDFYRVFEVPGLGHCFGGASGTPTGLFAQLRRWVEDGAAPDQTAVDVTDLAGATQHRIVCAYPQRAEPVQGCADPAAADCWTCVE